MNSFTYRTESYIGSGVTVYWTAEVGDMVFTGQSGSSKAAYRHAKRVVRRHNRMLRLLNKENNGK